MASAEASKLIQVAFSDRPALAIKVQEVAAQHPQHAALFASIANYVCSLRFPSSGGLEDERDARPVKRQRVEDDNLSLRSNPPKNEPLNAKSTSSDASFTVSSLLLSVRDVSFTSPQRKKLSLDFTAEGFSGRSVGDGTVAFMVRWRDIEHAICVPVPEKAQPHYNFCIFPKDIDVTKQPADHPTNHDAIVWTVPEKPPELATGEWVRPGESSYRSLLKGVLNTRLPDGMTVVEPDEKEFVSNLVQAHRKGERATHVRAFRGTKDGYLYFLPSGILWGFRKPLLFFSFVDITSISYTSVLQRTFNLNISVSTVATDFQASETTEYEFSMIDQEDHPAIDAYVKRHGLHDASMAEGRRAKVTQASAAADAREVGSREEDSRNGQAGVEDEDEDEDEGEDGEDYDPGSEGESEGSGSSTGDDHADGDALSDPKDE